MVRSAAKNYTSVAVVTDPEDYTALLAEMQANDGALTPATRFGLAKKAFTHTARYDAAIANWMRNDPMPRFTIREHDAGFVAGAARQTDGPHLYWRISQFMQPNALKIAS